MSRWFVKESCKAGPGVYLQSGQIIDLALGAFAGLTAKVIELAAQGLLESISNPNGPVDPPLLVESGGSVEADPELFPSEEPVKKSGTKKK